MKGLTIEEEVSQIEETIEFHYSELERLRKELKHHKNSIGVLETFLQGGCVVKAMQD